VEWLSDAACRTENPELFFPAGDSNLVGVAVMRAKEICRRCPVATPCLEFALATDQKVGVWGGLSESERRYARRRSPVTPDRRAPLLNTVQGRPQ
jgi:WhiB family redox-sensing transcriptional regulator